MNSRDLFKEKLCNELGIPNITAIGETDDVITLQINDNDVITKNRIKNWMNNHNWLLDDVINNDVKIASNVFVHNKYVTYKHNNHKIIIICL